VTGGLSGCGGVGGGGEEGTRPPAAATGMVGGGRWSASARERVRGASAQTGAHGGPTAAATGSEAAGSNGVAARPECGPPPRLSSGKRGNARRWGGGGAAAARDGGEGASCAPGEAATAGGKASTGGGCRLRSPASLPTPQAGNGCATAAAAAPGAKPATASRGGAGAAVDVTPSVLQQAITGRKRSIFTSYRKSATERYVRGAPGVKRKGEGERRPVGLERKGRRDERARGSQVVAASGMRRPTRYWQLLRGHAADAQGRPSGAAH